MTLGDREHGALDGPSEDRVAGLLGSESVMTATLGHPLRLHDEVGRKRGRADGADLSRPDQVRQGTEGLVEIRAVVGPVQLVKIDVVSAKAPEAGFDRPGDPAG